MENYEKAYKLAKKEYSKQVSKGNYPYLPSMEDIIGDTQIAHDDVIGLVNIPSNLIVGTAYAGRTNSFASNFMPLLDKDTEFAKKWISLCNAHLEEGIREPIKVYEYMNRFYVVEGNKRVSVLKYFGAASIPGVVTRKVPVRTGEEANTIYYEFMEFYEITRIYRIQFSKAGSYARLMELLPEDNNSWSDDFRQDFLSTYYRFEAAITKNKAAMLDLTYSDIFLELLEQYGYEAIKDLSSNEMNDRINSCYDELRLIERHDVLIDLEPDEPVRMNIINRMFSGSVNNIKAAFINNKSVETSGWVYGHELGRMHVENVFGDKLETKRFEISTSASNLDSDAATDELVISLEEIIAQGYKVLFTTTRELLKASLKVAIDHPEVIVLNCSLNMPHKYVRTYYGRMYEAKFIMGAIAAAYSETDSIGYLADYPIYGMTANINAFALGAKFINPRAKVYLEWETLKEPSENSILDNDEIKIISFRDMVAPGKLNNHFGICKKDGDRMVNLAMPVWNWGELYETILRSIFNGSYKKEDDVALNYWWGMNAGAIDIFLSHHLPADTKKLAEFLKQSIKNMTLQPFCGKIVSQDLTVYSDSESCVRTEQLMTMPWLVDNVVGRIPTVDELREDAQPIVRLQGVLGGNDN